MHSREPKNLTRLEYMRFFVENGTSDLECGKHRRMNPLKVQGIGSLDSWKEMMKAEIPREANGDVGGKETRGCRARLLLLLFLCSPVPLAVLCPHLNISFASIALFGAV